MHPTFNIHKLIKSHHNINKPKFDLILTFPSLIFKHLVNAKFKLHRECHIDGSWHNS